MMRGKKEIKISDGPIPELPEELVFEILVRISSVKTITLCKNVCKSWRGLISEPRFAKLHLARSKICLLVQNVENETTMGTMRLLNLDEDSFHSANCICEPGSEPESCEICRSDTMAIAKLKIPVAGIMSNTCDGLLCLYSYSCFYSKVSLIVVCNPVTGEFVILPELDRRVKLRAGWSDLIPLCGLGLDPKTGRYKVVVMYTLPTPNSKEIVVLKAVVHVLGTDSWRDIDSPDVSVELISMRGQALLGGALCWVYMESDGKTYGVASFDFDSEQFCYRSLPSLPFKLKPLVLCLVVTALGDRLCVYPFCPNDGKLDMCTLVDSSLEWISHDIPEVQDSLKLLCRLDDGALLMFIYSVSNELVYYDPLPGTRRYRRLSFDNDTLVVITYTPSFLSLKDIVRLGKAEVISV